MKDAGYLKNGVRLEAMSAAEYLEKWGEPFDSNAFIAQPPTERDCDWLRVCFTEMDQRGARRLN